MTEGYEKFHEIGKKICKGFENGIQQITKEACANNERKRKGIPMKRKIHKKDPRNKIRKNFVTIQESVIKIQNLINQIDKREI